MSRDDDFFKSMSSSGRKLVVLGILGQLAWLAGMFAGIYWLLSATGLVQ